jgi:hypothetical protein
MHLGKALDVHLLSGAFLASLFSFFKDFSLCAMLRNASRIRNLIQPWPLHLAELWRLVTRRCWLLLLIALFSTIIQSFHVVCRPLPQRKLWSECPCRWCADRGSLLVANTLKPADFQNLLKRKRECTLVPPNNTEVLLW